MSNYYDEIEKKTRALKRKRKKVRDTAATEDIQLPMEDMMRVHSKLDNKTKRKYAKDMMDRVTVEDKFGGGKINNEPTGKVRGAGIAIKGVRPVKMVGA